MMDEMWIFDDVWIWMCHQKLLRGEFHGSPVLAASATPREPCAAELRVALRGCAAALCQKLGTARRAEVARLKRFLMFLTVPDAKSLRGFLAPLATRLVFFFCSRAHLRTLQLWFVSLPGKGAWVFGGLDDGKVRVG